jgi:hypothetical protein
LKTRVKLVSDEIDAPLSKSTVAKATKTRRLDDEILWSAVGRNFPDLIGKNRLRVIKISISPLERESAAVPCQLNGAAFRVVSLPDLSRFLAAARSKVDPVAVARPTGNNVVGAGIGLKLLRRAAGYIGNVNFTPLVSVRFSPCLLRLYE